MRTFFGVRAAFVAVLGLGLGCVNASSEPENTVASCSDGVDNDLDGAKDCFDIECVDFPACASAGLENCVGGADEDNDGRADCLDPDCNDGGNTANSTNDQACAPAVEDCTNGVDDDGDGLIDCLDPACDADPICPDEICNNNLDDDGDSDIDCADLECAGDPACDLTEICNNGIDDDNDTKADCLDADCATAPNCTIENCTDNIDNDGDTFIDCADANCISDPNCSAGAICGDNIKNQAAEQCDGGDLNGQSCTTQGFASGTLSCDVGCLFNTSACVPAANCGNGTINAGEQCDSANLNGQSCITQGFQSGSLVCSAGCQLDTTGCFNNPEVCNDGADNDADGQIDCNDSDCVNAANCIIPAHGTCAAPVIASATTTFSGNTVGGSNASFSEGADIFAPCLVGSGQPEDVYAVTVNAGQTLSTSLSSASDLGIYIRISSGLNATTCGDITAEVDCVDAQPGGGAPETTSGSLAATSTLYIFVDGCEANCVPAGNTSGPYSLTITIQ